MYLKAIPNAAVRLLPLAIAGILSQPVLADGHLPNGVEEAKPLCASPWVNIENLDINIPCLLLSNAEGKIDQYRVSLNLVPEEKPYWTLGFDIGFDDCRPHINACRSAVNLADPSSADYLSLNIPGTMFAGVEHYLSMKKTGEANALSWDMPALMVEDPFMNDIIDVSIPVEQVTFPNNTTKAFDVGIGSGAFHYPQDGANMFYTITDRGPNIACDDSQDIIGTADFCKDAQGNVDNDSKIFPVPAFTPSIYGFQLGDNPGEYTLMQTLKLKNTAGEPITGITNNLTMLDASGNNTTSNTERSYAADGSLLNFDNGGLDTEALVKLNNGTFWLGEEYAPSLVHVAADGTIMTRVVPQGVESQLTDAGYPVSGMLPSVLAKRKLNRGIESVAVSPDNKYLYTIMQSPLSNPDADAYKASRNVRVLKMSLNDDGSIKEMMGEYVYQMDLPQTFVADAGRTKQSDVKISEMVALDTDDLVVLERISQHTRLYRIKIIEMTTNILGSPWDNVATSPSLENSSDLSAVSIMPLHKSLVLDSRKLHAQKDIVLPKKVEGVALLDDKFIALINDNDFGITGEKSQIFVIDAYQDLIAQSGQRIHLQEVGRYDTGLKDESAAEIVAFDARSKQVLFINASTSKVEMLDVNDPANPSKKAEIDVAADVSSSEFTAGGINSVAVSKAQPMFAVAVENTDKQAEGVVAVYQLDDSGNATFQSSHKAGALPDMVTFSPDGNFIVVANEGEPSDDYTHDPEGSISVINVATGTVSTAGFASFTSQMAELKAQGLRVFGNKGQSTLPQDLEPEYITVSADSTTAYVSLQENNALAVVDLATAEVTGILPLGFKDHNKPGNEIDASNKDDSINFANYPVLGMYQPDSIASYEYMGETYIVTANEGDARDYDGFSEEVRVADLNLDATAYPNAAELQADSVLGRLKTTTSTGDTDGDGDIDQIYSYGARSFSIWNSKGELVFDSGNDVGIITANKLGFAEFNSNEGGTDSGDSRSDDKGAEPEALAVGKIGHRTYAFVGLERTGGIMVYDITNPMKPFFIEYVRNTTDVAPEGMAFVPWDASPNGQPMLIVGNEVSGTVAIYQINITQY